VFKWINSNAAAFWWIMIASLVALAGALILVPILVIRIPADYFVAHRRPGSEWMRRPALRAAFLLVKNVLGYAFVVAGLIMLVVPGQGILTILIGTSLADFPGKFRLQRWLLTRRGVLGSINWLRQRAGKDPLVL
jgi:hypothetical protein